MSNVSQQHQSENNGLSTMYILLIFVLGLILLYGITVTIVFLMSRRSINGVQSGGFVGIGNNTISTTIENLENEVKNDYMQYLVRPL